MANVEDKTSEDVRDEQRRDPAFARERFELLLPEANVRKVCLRLLADSIERVHQKYGPARWGLTLRWSKKIHLNVGRLLAFGIHDEKVWIALDKTELSDELIHYLETDGKRQEEYTDIPNVMNIALPAKLIPDLLPKIEQAYLNFLDIAGNSATQTPYRKSHSPGAISYLREALHRPDLPDPVYNTIRYWKIAPGQGATFWEENRQSGIIAIGWGQAGDPRAHNSREALAQFLAKRFSYNEQEARANVRQVWSFLHEIKPGDIIVANQGQSKVVGRGEVLGPAEYRKDRGEYGNCLPVRWFDTTEREIIMRQTSWFTTVQEIRPDVYKDLFEPEDMGSIPSKRVGIYDYLREQQLHFPAELVTTYMLSLKTKPFVILSGISGTGKTKLAQAIAEWARSTQPGDVRYHEFISVRPDWLDGKEVLGFYNVLTEEYSIRPFARLLLQAHRIPEQPHFAILDEMNLARVEHYFADLLSATESRMVKDGQLKQEAVHLHDDVRCLPVAAPKSWNRPEKCGSCKATIEEIANCQLHFDGVQMVPPKLPVPTNVYITGTVNIDETTHMFSPKVLDRANVIEFNEVDLLGYGQTATPSEFVLDHGDIDLGKAPVAQQEHFMNAPEKVRSTLAALNQLLAESNLHFGYRVANEISLYVTNAMTFVGTNAVDTALDIQVLQKVLPKLHGSKQKLLGPLWRLLVFAISGKSDLVPYSDQEFDKIQLLVARPGSIAVMPRSAAKLARMLRVLRSQGFVSFIE